MRTFPKSLANFRSIVEARGDRLRTLGFEELEQLATAPVEEIRVDSHPATIALIVQPQSDGSLRVVLQGFMESRLLPGKNVALDGFYKHPDGRVTPMADEELYEFD